MPDDVRNVWGSISAILAENAPKTAACLNGPANEADLNELRECLRADIPDTLLQSLSCHDGMQLKPLEARLFPPAFIPYNAARATKSYMVWQEVAEVEFGSSFDDEGIAGDEKSTFSPLFLPIAGDTAGDEYFIDLRPGDLHACIYRWYQSSGAIREPLWGSFEMLLGDVYLALKAASEGTTHEISGYQAKFEGQSIRWYRV
ncbi:SMI1/KNR4 family protein [Streptomyces nigra]|uniref:SMI1/KNR4 family protein n=1 Tax=Streptomyces nigra TaxID=1827580 RepID=UPI0036B4DD4D